MLTRSFQSCGRSRFLRVIALLGVLVAGACSTNDRQRATSDTAGKATEEQQQAAPSAWAIAEAQQEMEAAGRELEKQVDRERRELPRREETLPGGKVRALAREEMRAAVQGCRTAPRRFVQAEVQLDVGGRAQSVKLRTGSGEPDCDHAVIRALEASEWVPCQEIGEQAPCRVSYALSLGSPLH